MEIKSIVERHSEDIECLKKEEINLSDNVSHLEEEHKRVANKINEIDDALEKLNDNIRTFKVYVDDKDVHVRSNENEERKQCRYDRRGYCRQLENCPFLHIDEVCQNHAKEGICSKLNCKLRHPKPCRYGLRCFRGKFCRYLHSDSSCHRCEQFSSTLYYCELCEKSFCQNCTNKEAHYAESSNDLPNCENIHQGNFPNLGCDLNSCTGTLTL